MTDFKKRLEYLRRELRAERISYGELAELQELIPHIAADDVELLEAAGVPEFECNDCDLGVTNYELDAEGRCIGCDRFRA